LPETTGRLEKQMEQADASSKAQAPVIEETKLRDLEFENERLRRDIVQLWAEINSRPAPMTQDRCRRSGWSGKGRETWSAA
jgi:hypothetical protein